MEFQAKKYCILSPEIYRWLKERLALRRKIKKDIIPQVPERRSGLVLCCPRVQGTKLLSYVI